MNDAAASQRKQKLIGIELVRFACALSILLWHYQHFAYVGDAPSRFSTESQPFYYLLSPIYKFGYVGVQIFWCISGFIFFWKYGESIRSRRVSGFRFFILRFSRLYPLHIATLIFVAVVQQYYFRKEGAFFIVQWNDMKHFLLQLIMASNWGFENGDSFNGPIWSISLEVLVYCLFYFVTRFFGASLAVAGAITGIALVCILKKFNPDFISHCVLFFFAGGMTAVVTSKASGYRVAHAVILDVLATLGILAAFGLALVPTTHIRVSPYLLALGGAPCLLFLIARHFKVPEGAAGVISIAGNMTYSSYLLHFPLELTIASFYLYQGASIPLYSHKFFALYLSTVLCLAYLCYKFFEMPSQGLIRERFLRRTPANVGELRWRDRSH
jgi:peptidoglycan/LPS O-acetylase OafA/YrhL